MPESDNTVGRPVRAYNAHGYFSDYSTEEIIAKKMNFFKGWECAAGTENINIDFDGHCQAASCGILLNLENQTHTSRMGNVFDGTFIPASGWATCDIQACSCGADIFIPKHRADASRSLLKKYSGSKEEENKRLPPNSNNFNSLAAVERTHSSRYKQIFWEIGRLCNFDCTYCPPFVHNKTEKPKTWEMLNQAYAMIKERFLKGDGKGNFIISGGEPTANPHYMKLAKMISNDGHKLSTHTNGTKSIDYYRELIIYRDINISLHFEYIDRFRYHIPDLLEGVINKKIELTRRGDVNAGHCEIIFMIKPRRLDEALAFEKKLIAVPGFLDCCTHTFMPIRTNDIIQENKLGNFTNRNGNQLLNTYPPQEMDQMGSRTNLFKSSESLLK